MDYQADWKSKILVALFGKRRLMTLLDTCELMQKKDFKDNSEYRPISNQIIFTAVAANAAVILTSIVLSRTVFAKARFFSPVKLLTEFSVVVLAYYAGALYLSQAIKKEVQLGKYPYLKIFDKDFLFHFNFLQAKYKIDEKMQTENIFIGRELDEWMNELYKKISQVKE